MPILLFGFRVLFLPVDMLIAFCWMTSMFQILSMRHSRPPIHWKRSKIRREEGEEKRLSHTPTEWWILFGLCLLSPCLAQLDCYVGFYGEKQRPCQTPSSTRNEKKEKQVQRWDEEGDAAGAKRETWFQEFRGCGLAGSKTQQTERAMQCEKKKKQRTESRNRLWTNILKPADMKMALKKCPVWEVPVCGFGRHKFREGLCQ